MSAKEQAWEKFWSAFGKFTATQIVSFWILKCADLIPIRFGITGLIALIFIAMVSFMVCLFGIPFALQAFSATRDLWRMRKTMEHEQKEML